MSKVKHILFIVEGTHDEKYIRKAIFDNFGSVQGKYKLHFEMSNKDIVKIRKNIKKYEEYKNRYNHEMNIIIVIDIDQDTIHRKQLELNKAIQSLDCHKIYFKRTVEEVFFNKVVTSSSDKKKLATNFVKGNKNNYSNSTIKNVENVKIGSNVLVILENLIK